MFLREGLRESVSTRVRSRLISCIRARVLVCVCACMRDSVLVCVHACNVRATSRACDLTWVRVRTCVSAFVRVCVRVR